MGRHSSGARWHFIRSVIVWAAPWVGGLVVIVALVWLASLALTGDGRAASASGKGPPGGGEGKVAPAEKNSPGPSSPSSSTRAPASDSPARRSSGRTSSSVARPRHRPPLITRGVTVQVLDTTNRPRAVGRWVRRLTRLGYRVVSVEPGLGPYPQTTVFWSRPTDRRAARALAARFGWRTGPRRPSLSPAVSVHVVIGRDAA